MPYSSRLTPKKLIGFQLARKSRKILLLSARFHQASVEIVEKPISLPKFPQGSGVFVIRGQDDSFAQRGIINN